MSIWDDPDLKPAPSPFVSFNNIGDGVSGVVTWVDKKTWPATKDGPAKTVPQLGITTDSGEEKILTASATMLHEKVYNAHPEVGDHIDVYFVSQAGAMKLYDVEVKRGEVADAVGTDVDKTKAPF